MKFPWTRADSAQEEAYCQVIKHRIEAVPLSNLDKMSRTIRAGTGIEYMLAEIADLRRRIQQLERRRRR